MKFQTLLSICFLFVSHNLAASTGYFRMADIHGDKIVFTAEGDLWVTKLSNLKGDAQSNTATRLTTNPAEEKEAQISPDGSQIAYAANYEGTTEVYLIPISGGVARRLTFENGRVRVHGWTYDNEVLYSVNSRVGMPVSWTLRTVNPKSLVSTPIPLADAVEGAIDQNGSYVYFVQFGLQITGDNTRIYRGGAKGELWRYKLDSRREATRLSAKHIGSVRQPMVFETKLYFVSDASGSDNIWMMNLDGSDIEQVTQYKDWPVRSANLNEGRIIFQLGADLHLLNLSTGKSRLLDIDLVSDFANLREQWTNKPLKYATSAFLAGDFDKVVVTARGRVAVAGIDKSRLVEVSTPLDSRTRKAILSHDGKSIYAFNDASGEMEIWQFAADGSRKSKQLTKDGSIYRQSLTLSPDGNWIVHDDANGDLWLLDTRSLENIKIVGDIDGSDLFGRIAWSANSAMLAIPQNITSSDRRQILLYSIQEKKFEVITTDKYDSYSPAFGREGDWLYFLSDRHFVPTPGSPWGDRNMGVMLDRRSLIFAYGLNEDARFPFQVSNELLAAEEEEKKAQKEKRQKNKNSDEHSNKHDEAEKGEADLILAVDWSGIPSRLWQVPIEPGNYSNLAVNDKFIFVLDKSSKPGAKPTLKSIAMEASPKTKSFANKVTSFRLSDDGKRMLVTKDSPDNNDLYIVPAKAKFPKDVSKSKLRTKDWQLLTEPRQEWNQLFHDAWVMHRDSFFDADMRGLDWAQVKEKYQPLLARITDRHELNDVFSQMMGELNALHSQVRGGDFPKELSRPKASTFGATLDQSKNGVVITHIYRSDPELPLQSSPLLRPGVDALDGDLIQSINGVETRSLSAVYQQLRNQAGKQVLLELKREGASVKTIVVPVTPRQDYGLRYGDWVNGNSAKVKKASSKIAYLHLRAMGSKDVGSFARDFYGSFQKEGMIIDVRRNNGGNVDSLIIEKLLRKAWMFWQARKDQTATNMQQAFRGHLVVLADERTYSDGETFAAAIKALDLAPVIGKRTAGAGVWLSGRNRLSDNGIARVAEFPVYAMDGRWIVEGHGVEPTIEVDNLPYATFNGKDAQLEAGIDYLLKKIKREPMAELKNQPFPQYGVPASDVIRH